MRLGEVKSVIMNTPMRVSVAGQASLVVKRTETAVRKCVSGRSRRSRAAEQQVLAGRDAVTMTTEDRQVLAAVDKGR